MKKFKLKNNIRNAVVFNIRTNVNNFIHDNINIVDENLKRIIRKNILNEEYYTVRDAVALNLRIELCKSFVTMSNTKGR